MIHVMMEWMNSDDDITDVVQLDVLPQKVMDMWL